MRKKIDITICIITFLILIACGTSGNDDTPPATRLMPNISGYTSVKGQEIQKYIAASAKLTALLAKHPEMLPFIEGVDGITECYQNKGAINLQLYSDNSYPLSSGIIAIVDGDRINSWDTFLGCLVDTYGHPELSPCANAYTLKKDGNEFYIAYAGTTQEICDDFCDELEGCQ